MPAKSCSVRPFFFKPRKVLALLKSALFAKTWRLMPAPWKPMQTLRKLKLKISRTLWTCAFAFSSGRLALMLDYTPSVPPLPPLKYGSDGRKGQQPVWGQQLMGRWMRGEKGVGGGRGGCVSLWAILDTHRSKDGIEREWEREDSGGGRGS